MTAHPIAPMTDAELAALRVESTIRRSPHHTMASVSIDAMQRLFALVDAIQARALPPARLLRTVEEVEGLAEGRFMVCRPQGTAGTHVWRHRPGGKSWECAELGFLVMLDDRMVGATVVGPLPDVEPLGEEG